jgi:hypothetical protein
VDPSHLVDTQFQRGSQNLDLSAVRSTPGHLIPQGGLLRPPEHACVGHDDRRDAGYCTAVNSAASWSWTSLWCVQEPPCSPCSLQSFEGGWRKQAVPVQAMSLMAACVGPGLRGDGVQGRWVEENIEAMDEEGLRQLVFVLDQENPELYKWLTQQETPPAHMVRASTLRGAGSEGRLAPHHPIWLGAAADAMQKQRWRRREPDGYSGADKLTAKLTRGPAASSWVCYCGGWCDMQEPLSASKHAQEANAVFQGLQARTRGFLDTLAPAATRAAPGVQWTRPWADDGKELKPGVDKWADGNQN